MNLFSTSKRPYSDVSELLNPSELDGFPVDRIYTKTRLALTSNSQRREIGHLGIWTLSSAKVTNGIDQLRDNDLQTYWQSDGSQPHSVLIYFQKKTAVSELCIYLDFKLDESYTPNRLQISIGNSQQELYEVQTPELDEPTGWYNFALGRLVNGVYMPVKTHLVQLNILQNQLNGRDTHIRQMKIFGPREEFKVAFPTFSTAFFNQYAVLRQ